MIHYLSCEFVLKWLPNGGTAVLIRSFLISLMLYIVTIALKSRLEPNATWGMDLSVGRSLVSETIPWFGAIFAGVYAALYSRFASQWNYLANLYNQIMASAVQHPPTSGDAGTAVLRMWQAGFVEDAEDLHLAGKPMFASIIHSMLTKDEVKQNFSQYAPGGAERLNRLEARIVKAMEASIRHQGLRVSDTTLPAASDVKPSPPVDPVANKSG